MNRAELYFKRAMINDLKTSVIHLEYALVPYITIIISLHNILFWKEKLYTTLALLFFFIIWYIEMEITCLLLGFGLFILYKTFNNSPSMPTNIKEIQKEVEKWIINTLIEDEKEKKGKEVADSATLLQLTLKQCWGATEQIKYFTSYFIPLIFPFLWFIETRILSYSLLSFVFILSFVGVLKDRKKLLFGFEKIKNAVIINPLEDEEEDDESEHSDSSDEEGNTRAPSSPFKKKQSLKELVDTGNIVKEGFLSKRGAINQNWQRRYFVLTKDLFLYYFKKETDTKSLGVIDCQNSKVKLGMEENLFTVRDRSKGREFILQSEDLTDRNSWVNSIHQTMLTKNNSIKKN